MTLDDLPCLLPPAAAADPGTRPVHAVRPDALAAFVAARPPAERAWITANGFAARTGQLLLLPALDGVAAALFGLGDATDPLAFGGLPKALPAGAWRLDAATLAASGFGPDDALLVSLVGKGVCFDSGGYDIKPSSGMLRMKKDMGGAAIMLALADLVMRRDLPLRLELRIGCVENSVSGRAMRPGDVLATRAGLTVEVNNTDAEGRLVLADLLADAAEASPRLLLDAATLTGAARVALGPDLPALFTDDEALAAELLAAGLRTHDPLWRLPLWSPYAEWLETEAADLSNVSARPMAGAVTAALFLRRFVPAGVSWAHLDAYCWNDRTRPGRPEGGEVPCVRALFALLTNLCGDGT